MTPDVARALARYNRWMNDKVYAASARLTDEERRRDRGAFFGSIHATLNHLMVADRVWLGRLREITPPPGHMAAGVHRLDQELYADFAELRAARVALDAEIDAWVAPLTADQLAADMQYVRGGQPRRHPRWWAVVQLFNHETHHRGQITTLLTQAGQDCGATDVLAMLVEEQAGG